MNATNFLILLVIVFINGSNIFSECPSHDIHPKTCLKEFDTEKYLIRNFTTETSDLCCTACATEQLCRAWNWYYESHVAEAKMCQLRNKTGPSNQKKKFCDSGTYLPPTPAPIPPPKNAKNVLYIIIDDLRTNLGTYGHPFMLTPRLDKFAKESLVFEQAHVNSQMCVPTRNSFLSGRRPQTTRVFNAGIGNADFRVIGLNWTTLPGYFKQHEYFTTAVGKVFHPNKPPQGDGGRSWSDLDKYPYFYPKPGTCENNNVWCEGSDDDVYEDNLIYKEAIHRLHAAVNDSSRPFFLAVGFHKPHTPYRAPSKWYDMYPAASKIQTAKYDSFPSSSSNVTGLAWFSCQAEGKQYPINHSIPYPLQIQQLLRRAYYASISYTDHFVGLLLDELETLGFVHNTTVVIHADHGYQLGERNIWCKETNYNLATHIPLLIRAPFGKYALNMGKRTSSLVEIVDLYPTLVELSGLPTSQEKLDGTSFAPIVADATINIKDSVFSQYARKRCFEDLFAQKKSELPPSIKNCTFGHFMGLSVRQQDYRLTEWYQCNQTTGEPYWDQLMSSELYFHGADVGDDFDSEDEMHNLAYDPPHKKKLDTLHLLLREQWGNF